jgi:hypothetical protein
MNLQKVAAWSTIGSFLITCLVAYHTFRPQHPAAGPTETVVQPVTSNQTSLWIVLAVIVIAGLLHFIAAMFPRKQVVHTLPAPARALSEVKDPKQSLVSSPPTFIGGREFVGGTITPEYLVGLFEGHTSIQAKSLIEPFIGKWMRVSGELDEVTPSSSPHFAILTLVGRGMGGPGRAAGIFMYFQTAEWVDRLRTLRRGDKLTVIGKIEDVISVRLTLASCELEGFV